MPRIIAFACAHHVADMVRLALVVGCAIALIAADAVLPGLAL